MHAILAVLAFVLGSIYAPDPSYPWNVVSGGTVIAELQVAEGKVKEVAVLSGAEPFTDSATSALSQWRLPPDVQGTQLAVVCFRHPYLYNLSAGEPEIRPARAPSQLPYPVSVIQPLYPPNAVAEGGVVLRAEISPDGIVSNVEAISEKGALTGTSIDALRHWRFVPAQNEQGKRIGSQAYVVFVFRLLLSAP